MMILSDITSSDITSSNIAGGIAIIASLVSIGYALPYAVKFVQFIVSLALRRKELLEGTWHAYHFTAKDGVTFLRYEKWIIKRNVLNKLKIATEDPENPELRYKGGIISQERGYLYILLKGVKHKEAVQMQFFDPIPTGQDIVFGLAMGVDFNNKPQCLVRIMSRKELADEEAREILLSKTAIEEPGIVGFQQKC